MYSLLIATVYMGVVLGARNEPAHADLVNQYTHGMGPGGAGQAADQSMCTPADNRAMLDCVETLSAKYGNVMDKMGRDVSAKGIMEALCSGIHEVKMCMFGGGRDIRCLRGPQMYMNLFDNIVCGAANKEYKELFSCIEKLSGKSMKDLIRRSVDKPQAVTSQYNYLLGDLVQLVRQGLNDDFDLFFESAEEGIMAVVCRGMYLWKTGAAPIMKRECGLKSMAFVKSTLTHVQPQSDKLDDALVDMEKQCETLDIHSLTHDDREGFSEHYEPYFKSIIGIGARYFQYRSAMGMEKCSYMRQGMKIFHCLLASGGNFLHHTTLDAKKWNVQYFSQLFCLRLTSDFDKCLVETDVETKECPTLLDLESAQRDTCLFLNTPCVEGNASEMSRTDTSMCTINKLDMLQKVIGMRKSGMDSGMNNFKVIRGYMSCILNAHAERTEPYERLCGADSGASHGKMITKWRDTLDKLSDFMERFMEEATVFSPVFEAILKMYI